MGCPSMSLPSRRLHSVKRRSNAPWRLTHRRPTTRLVSGRHPVFPRFAGADINALAVVHFHFDGLVTAVTAYIKTHVVTFFAQFPHRLVRNVALDFNVAT